MWTKAAVFGQEITYIESPCGERYQQHELLSRNGFSEAWVCRSAHGLVVLRTVDHLFYVWSAPGPWPKVVEHFVVGEKTVIIEEFLGELVCLRSWVSGLSLNGRILLFHEVLWCIEKIQMVSGFHGDLKPDAIMLYQGRVMLMDRFNPQGVFTVGVNDLPEHYDTISRTNGLSDLKGLSSIAEVIFADHEDVVPGQLFDCLLGCEALHPDQRPTILEIYTCLSDWVESRAIKRPPKKALFAALLLLVFAVSGVPRPPLVFDVLSTKELVAIEGEEYVLTGDRVFRHGDITEHGMIKRITRSRVYFESKKIDFPPIYINGIELYPSGNCAFFPGNERHILGDYWARSTKELGRLQRGRALWADGPMLGTDAKVSLESACEFWSDLSGRPLTAGEDVDIFVSLMSSADEFIKSCQRQGVEVQFR